MKIIFILCLLIYNPINGQSNDNSDSTVEVIELIKKTLDSIDSLSFKIQFINRHRGEYKVNSIMEFNKNRITIKSHIKNMLDEESDISFEFSKTEFDKELNRQLDILSDFNKQLVLGGNYQEIKVDYNSTIRTYKARKALSLMNLFDSGGLKYKSK